MEKERRRNTMFRSIGRILRWTGEYRKRLYAGCICSFFATWCTAGPVMVAAWALGKVIEDYRGGEQIKGSFIWLCPVSYTHLDVYKRQGYKGSERQRRRILLFGMGTARYSPFRRSFLYLSLIHILPRVSVSIAGRIRPEV